MITACREVRSRRSLSALSTFGTPYPHSFPKAGDCCREELAVVAEDHEIAPDFYRISRFEHQGNLEFSY